MFRIETGKSIAAFHCVIRRVPHSHEDGAVTLWLSRHGYSDAKCPLLRNSSDSLMRILHEFVVPGGDHSRRRLFSSAQLHEDTVHYLSWFGVAGIAYEQMAESQLKSHLTLAQLVGMTRMGHSGGREVGVILRKGHRAPD